MEIRNITKEDLPKLAELISCEELATRDDICFERSKLMTGTMDDEENVIVAFILLRQRPIRDFFGGRIPDEIIDDNDEDYEEGDEFIFRDETEENFSDSQQFEMLCAYERFNVYDDYISELYHDIYFEDRHPIGIIWRDNKTRNIHPVIKDFYVNDDFNGEISCDTPDYY